MNIRPLLPLALLAAALLSACGSTPTSQAPAAPYRTVQAAQIQRAAVAPAVYEIAYSARQNTVFVASAGGFGENAPASKLLRLDPATLAVKGELALPLRGFGLALDDAANRLYIGNTTQGSITVVDTATNQVIKTIEMMDKVKGADGKEKYEHHFRELVIDSANQRVYAPGLSSDGSALYVLNTRTLTREKVIPGFGQVATGIALDAANNRLFISNMRGGLYEVDTRSLSIRKHHAVAADQLLNLAYDAQGKRLFATDQGLASISERRQKAEPGFKPTPGNRVVVFDADTAAIRASLPTGDGPIAPLFDAQRERLYVTSRGAGTVSVFDTRSQQLLQTIALPAHPNSLALDSRNNVLFVTVKNGRDAARGSNESVTRIAF
ncbi:YncE family protein [Xenophilus arseniciresistens]|uniref:YncE family protein n=1 Tax=Xenophilus arseniciresistens TaxID=1283306 RepID=A0AAE3N6G5_9BURK|nr:YncE family protein [Xenophilus arseniciresistens]MDA7415758.1 YncE family protein [Xenophilus arseniciresistens]